ncbi:MAG: prepilin-type N-terminal cleavage/methylation domain-containing protein [bacterium]|nr:prepilin-type N-terminal cleavage/methylation domain-containing protein [bacterium]
MLKKIYQNRAGLTLMEILIAIAIISIMSSFFIISISKTDLEAEIVIENEKLMADIRYARNLAMSRTVHDFGAGAQYPAGGYGIYFEDLATANAKYIIFADAGTAGLTNEDYKIKETILSNSAIELNDYVADKSNFYFTFVTENQVNTNMAVSLRNTYQVEMLNKGPGSPTDGYRSVINIGERSLNSANEVEYVWGNIGYAYSVYEPVRPPPEPPLDDRFFSF